MKRYSRDPYRTKARFSSICPDCGGRIGKNEDITVWPASSKGRKARHWKCSETDYRRFEAAAYDEAVLTGNW